MSVVNDTGGQDTTMDPLQTARIDAAARAAVEALGPSPNPEALQRHLYDHDVNGIDAVFVTMKVLNATLHDANAMYFSHPLRTAERDLQNSFIDTLELAATTDEQQRQICFERNVPWRPPAGVARNVGTGTWPVNGLRHPITSTTCGWYLWAGEGPLSQDPDYFEPVHVEHLYERCPEILPHLGLPPGWRLLVAPGYSDVWEDPDLLTETDLHEDRT